MSLNLVAWFLIHALLCLAARATTEISFQHQTCSLSIKSATGWTACVEAPWISFPQPKGSGNAELEFIVEENTTDVTRNAEIIVGDQKLSVTQHPASWILTSSAQAAHASVAASQSAEPAKTAAALALGQMTYHVDPNFSLAIEQLGGQVNAVARTSDGGAIIGGEFSTIGGQLHRCVAKIKADGTIDPTFNARGGFCSSGTDYYGARPHVDCLAVQTDGRIVVGGRFSSFNGTACSCIARLNGDGTLDTTFQSGSGFSGSVISPPQPPDVDAVALQLDGRIIVVGGFTYFNGTPINQIIRLNSDGSLDSTFNPGSMVTDFTTAAIAIQADGRIIIGGSYAGLKRLNVDGSVDTAFNPNINGICIALQSDGRLLVGGGTKGIARLNVDGTLDPSFNPGITFSYGARSIAVQVDSRIIVGGANRELARLNTDGSLDTTFNAGSGFSTGSAAEAEVNSIAISADGSVIVGGFFSSFSGSSACGVVRLTASGAMNAVLTDQLRIPANIAAVVPRPKGKWIVGGNFTSINGTARNGIAQLNADGSVDTGFDPGTGFDQNYLGNCITTLAVQGDGQILASGTFTTFNNTARQGLARITATGGLDSSFNPASSLDIFGSVSISAFAVQPDGRILVGGEFNYTNGTSSYVDIARLNADGSIDPTFKPGGSFTVYSGGGTTYFNYSSEVSEIGLQPDGHVIVGQTISTFSGDTGASVLRLNVDGSYDSSFPQSSGAIGSYWVTPVSAFSLAVQPDGHVVVAGSFTAFAGVTADGIARFNPDGSLDSLFNSSGSFDATVLALTLQADGRPVVGGNFTMFGNTACTSIAGLNVNGGLDTGFTVADPLIDPVYLLSRGDDNRLLLAGPSVFSNDVLQAGYVLLRPDAVPSFTTQPQSTSVSIGGTVTLTANASGYPQISYKWYKDGNLLSNQTTNSLALANATAATAGSYTVMATNSNGSTTSTSAVVAVIDNQSPPPDHGSGGGGGGGAFSPWTLVALAAATLTRIYGRRR